MVIQCVEVFEISKKHSCFIDAEPVLTLETACNVTNYTYTRTLCMLLRIACRVLVGACSYICMYIRGKQPGLFGGSNLLSEGRFTV